jgi:branched-chain amino acid transport system substrate-binding protein
MDAFRRRKAVRCSQVKVVQQNRSSWPSIGYLALATLFFASRGSAQNPSPPPYATIDKNAITYAGPGREAADDLTGADVVLGMLIPLQGPRQAEGEALLQAVRMAIDDEAANPLPKGRRLVLVARDESGPWGRASTEIVRMVTEDRAVALLTSADGGAAHLAEQVGNRLGVPVVTLASDATTTEINIPWLFRIPPSDSSQADAIVEDIYRQRQFRKVLLVTEDNHDGRVGSTAFEKAVQKLGVPEPTLLSIDTTSGDFEPYLAAIRGQQPEALVLWTGPQTSARILGGIEKDPVTVYLCQKAAQEPVTRLRLAAEGQSAWVPVARADEAATGRDSFEQRYRQKTGNLPSPAALAAYDAVRLVASALRRSGPNRARLRDRLAKTQDFPGAAGTISFDGAGNNQTSVILARIQ